MVRQGIGGQAVMPTSFRTGGKEFMYKPGAGIAAARILKRSVCGQSGSTFVETVIAVALIGSIVIACLSGLSTTLKATMVAKEESVGESLARSQMEYVKTVPYASGTTNYTAAPIPSYSEYSGYTATITASPVNDPEDGIQKVTVTIQRTGTSVISLEGYKVNR